MPTRDPQYVTIDGTAPNYHLAAGDDAVFADDKSELRVRNAGTAPVNLTMVTVAGIPDLVKSVPAGGELALGPLTAKLFGASAVPLTWSAVTSVTWSLTRT